MSFKTVTQPDYHLTLLTACSLVFSDSQLNNAQISFRDRLERTLLAQEIPCFSHRKSVSDSIVLDLKKADLTILHEGTAFEILNPRDSFRLSRIVSTPETKRESFGSGEDKTTSGLIEDARSTMSPDRTPSRRPGDMTSENSQRRATPMRSLFDDLPTAYSQITGDHNLMMATRSSSTDFRSSLMNPLADRDRVPGSGTSGHHSANDQCDQQIEKTGSVSNANEQRSILRQLSNGSSASAKSVVGGFARPLLRRPKRARAAKDRLSNFLFPRSKVDHEGSNGKRLSRSTSDNSLFSGSQEQIDQQDMGEPIHMGAFSESTSSLNLCQPNYHSARGRIDKSSTINDIVHQRPRRGSISKFRERPVTSWPDPFRHTRRTSSPAPFHESRESSCQHGVPHDENSQETDIGQGAHLSLVGDEPAAPLPSICGRLESQDNVKQTENDNPDVAIPAEQLSEHEKTTERVISNANEEQLSEQLAAVELDTWPSHPFTAAPHGSGTFIPYTSSTGILGGYMPRQPKGASGYNRGPNSTVSARQAVPFSEDQNANTETREEGFSPGEHKETLQSADDPPRFYPYRSQSAVNYSEINECGTFGASQSQIQDLGPGSSQSSSSQQLSESLISPLLRPHLRLFSGLRDLRSRSISHGGLSNNYSRLGQRRGRYVSSSRESEMQDDEQDWETIPESDQFSRDTFDTFVGQGAHRSGYADPYTSRLGQAMTGSSLADYSSYGSLAQEETSSWTPFDLPSSPPLPQASPFFHSQRAGPTNTHHPDHQSDMERSASSSDRHFQNTNLLMSNIPPLPATTSYLAGPPRPHSARAYRHPTPLGDSHTNPFCSSPPTIPRGADVCPGRLNLASGQASRVDGTSYSKFSFLDQSHITEEDTDLRSDVHTLGNVSTHSDEGPPPLRTPSPEIPPLHRTLSASSGWVTIQSTHESPAASDMPSTLPYRHQILTQTSRSRPGRVGHVEGPPSCGRRVTDSANDVGNAAPGASPKQAAAQSSSTERLIIGSSDEPTLVRSTPGSIYQSIRSRGQKGQSQRRSSNDIELQEWSQRSLGSRNLEATHGKGKDADMATTFSKPSLKRGPSTAALLATRTTFNSSSATSTRRTKRYRTDAEVRERLRIMDNIFASDIARPQAAMTFSSTSRFTGDEESVGSYLPWYRSTSGRYVFAEPPRLVPLQFRHSQLSTIANIVPQKRLGRRILVGLTLLFPFGWPVVALIGLGLSWPDCLIRWFSGGDVESFNDRERILARWITLGYTIVLIGATISLFMALFSK